MASVDDELQEMITCCVCGSVYWNYKSDAFCRTCCEGNYPSQRKVDS